MRWQKIPVSEGVGRTGSVWADANREWRLIPRLPMPKREQGFFGIVAETWEPHQDLRAARMVFMAAPGDKKTLRSSGNRFYACIDDGDLVEAESPELAVCRAALLTVRAA
jgi:hypothetical protein